jgi:hypothetical protein
MIVKLVLLATIIVGLLSAILVQQHAILVEERKHHTSLFENRKPEPPVMWGGDADTFKNYSQ